MNPYFNVQAPSGRSYTKYLPSLRLPGGGTIGVRATRSIPTEAARLGVGDQDKDKALPPKGVAPQDPELPKR